MTEKETGELLCLCRDFTALDREHQKLALDISKSLLNLQVPPVSVQGNCLMDSGKNKFAKNGGLL